MAGRVSHIGVVVNDLDRAVKLWSEAFALKVVHRLEVPAEGVRNALLSPSGTLDETYIELMEPTQKDDMDNAIARRLATAGEGVYHVAMISEDLTASEDALTACGLTVIRRPPAASATSIRLVVHPKSANGVLVELLEAFRT
jgi:methylmalonyl-CoA epimerase